MKTKKMKISDLLINGQAKLNFARRDLTQLEAFGITQEHLTAVENKLKQLESVKTDANSLTNNVASTVSENALRKDLLYSISGLHARLSVHFLNKPETYNTMRIKNLSSLKKKDLVTSIYSLLNAIEPETAKYIDVGITPELIESIRFMTNRFSDLLIAKETDKSDRLHNTAERTQLISEAYMEINKICKLNQL